MPVECLVNPSDASYRTYLATRLAFGQFAHPSTGYPDARIQDPLGEWFLVSEVEVINYKYSDYCN